MSILLCRGGLDVCRDYVLATLQELKRLSMRVAQLARENARQAAVLAKQEVCPA